MLKSIDRNIYFDANATTAMLPTALSRMKDVISTGPLNASSLHSSGDKARQILVESRDQVASLFGDVDAEDLIFTSGGTEGNWIAINSFRQSSSGIIFTTSVEHPSVIEPIKSKENFCVVGVSSDGIVDLTTILEKVVQFQELPLVSIQWVNSETGVIQPIKKIVSEIRGIREDTLIHVDAAQAVGRLNLKFDGLDLVTCSAHKLHGPHGIGALYISERAQQTLRGYYVGAGQEKNRRPGTENIPAIAGMAEAFRCRKENFAKHCKHLKELRDRFENNICGKLKKVIVICQNSNRIANTSSICFKGLDGMQLLANFDMHGIQCSMGSACSSAKPEPSVVLRKLGMSEADAYSTLRFSFSIDNSVAEIDQASEIICDLVKKIENNSNGYH